MRLAPERDYLNLKAAWRDLVKLCGGPTRAAAITRGCQSRISEAMAPDRMDRFPALDQVMDLEQECGRPLIAAFLADLAGFDLVPRGTGARPQTIHHHFARIVIEATDVQREMAAAMADGNLDDSERATLHREAQQAIDALHALQADLKPIIRKVAG